MTCNEFFCKINLPEVCRIYGVTGLQFIKLPVFGWIGYNQNLSQIVNLFQLFPDNELVKLYRHFTLDKTEVQEFTIIFSEHDEQLVLNDYMNIRRWKKIYQDSLHEAQSNRVMYCGRDYWLKTLMDKRHGFDKLPMEQVGLITEDLVKKYVSATKWPNDSVNQLMIPSFYTPLHHCSYEMVYQSSLEIRRSLFLNGEKGWYGTLGNNVVPNLPAIGKQGGFTWDYKCDYWTNRPLELSNDIPVTDCIKIWNEAKNSKFINSPLDVIIANKKENEIKAHLKQLSLAQVQELESKLGSKLLDSWQVAQYEDAQIGPSKFSNRNNVYWVQNHVKKLDCEYTNFTMTISKIMKSGDEFHRIGIIRHAGKEIPFIFSESVFNDSAKLYRAIKTFFLHHALGLPLVLSTYRNLLVDVISRFNRSVQVENLVSPIAQKVIVKEEAFKSPQ